MNFLKLTKIRMVALFGLATLLVTSQSHAAIPAIVNDLFTQLAADFNQLLTENFYPILILVLGAFIVAGWVMKGSKKFSKG